MRAREALHAALSYACGASAVVYHVPGLTPHLLTCCCRCRSPCPQSRVEQAGGYVWWDRVMGELAVSRAIGDHCLRPFVIAEPEVRGRSGGRGKAVGRRLRVPGGIGHKPLGASRRWRARGCGCSRLRGPGEDGRGRC